MRRVLFDEDVPRQLRRDLPEFTTRTVQEERWSSLKNGELLERASRTFDVLVTADKRLRYQQNVSSHNIGVVVLGTVDVRLPRLQEIVKDLREAIDAVQPRSVVVVTGGE